MNTLATFVHVSDLHFLGGSLDVNAILLWMKVPILDGLLGHHERSLMRLVSFVEELKAEAEREKLEAKQPQLIVTGDLTTMGADPQFMMADGFLGGVLKPPSVTTPTGLMVGDWKDRAITGNHDMWPGSLKFWLKPSGTLSQTFSFLPHAANPAVPLWPGGPELRFLRINTDAEVSGFERLRAVGSFRQQLDTLSASLNGLPRKKEIRVLFMHHSPYAGKVSSMGIDGGSRKTLEHFIAAHDIAVVLTGHIHNPPLVKSFPVHGRPPQFEYLEARCGTTTQVDPASMYVKRLVKKYTGIWPQTPKRPHNSLLVHRLLEENGEIIWDSEVYFLESSGFVPPPVLRPDILITRPFKVWPRPV